jgi:5-methylcytosine-specific restriction endonuclease McrA
MPRPATPCSHGASTSSRCTACRREHGARKRAAERAARELRPCELCGEPFYPARPTTSRLCSTACREAFRRRRDAADRAARQRAYYAATRDARRAYARAWHARRDRDELAARRAAYRAANLEAHRTYARRGEWRRRARLAAADVRTVTERDLRRLELRQAGACAYCGELRPLTLEHVVPIARGGRHAIGNLALACLSCNSSKGPRLLVEWRARSVARAGVTVAA